MLRPTRLLAFAGLVLIGLLYWKPLHTYEHTRDALLQPARGRGQPASQAEQRQLKQRLASVGTATSSFARRGSSGS